MKKETEKRRRKCHVCKVFKMFVGRICDACVENGYKVQDDGKIRRADNLIPKVIIITEDELRARVQQGAQEWKIHFDWTPADQMPSIMECVMKEILKGTKKIYEDKE